MPDLFRWIDQRSVYRGVRAIEQTVIVRTGHALDHAYKDDIVGWVHPEPGSRRAIPEVGSFAIRQVRLSGIENHRAVVPVH